MLNAKTLSQQSQHLWISDLQLKAHRIQGGGGCGVGGEMERGAKKREKNSHSSFQHAYLHCQSIDFQVTRKGFIP